MSDFRAHIIGDLDLTKAHADMNSFLNKYKNDLKIDVKIDGVNDVSKQFSDVGKQAGKTFTQELQRSINSKKVKYDLDTDRYAANISRMTAQLKTFDGQSSSKITTATKSLNIYKEEIKKIQSLIKSDGSVTDQDAFVKSFEKMQKAGDKYKNTLSQIKDEMSKTLGAGVAEKSANSVENYMNRNSKALKKYEADLKDIQEQYRKMLTYEDKLRIDSRFNDLKTKISSEGLTGRSGFEDLKRASKQIAQFATVYGAIQNVIYEVPRQMVQAVKDVNKAQIELRKVSTASESQLKTYWDDAAASAKKYGATISDVISNTADWSRLGYGLDQAKELSDATTLMQRVGDNMTQESSAQGIISTLKGFKLDANEVTRVIDSINEVANTQPIDTSGIFAGLERSASSMSAANNSLEQTIALITAANSVVQDPDSVGTAFKTISMRIRGASTDLEKAGLDTEGMASSTAKLREEMLALSGVDIMENENQFKSTYDILDELSAKWQTLTDIEQASVTELIAGKRQGNIVSALMSNFDIARETLDTASNKSEGSAERELENYQKGIEYSLDKFKAQFQELSTATIDSDIFKGFIDGGTKAIGVMTKLMDTAGGIPALITAFAGLKAFKNRDCFIIKRV